MTHTRKMVLDAFKHGTPATLVGRDGRMVPVEEAACAHCGCPKALHTRGRHAGCERCSCDRLIHRVSLDALLPIKLVD